MRLIGGVILERSLTEPGCLTHMMIKYLITDTHIFEMPSAWQQRRLIRTGTLLAQVLPWRNHVARAMRGPRTVWAYLHVHHAAGLPFESSTHETCCICGGDIKLLFFFLCVCVCVCGRVGRSVSRWVGGGLIQNSFASRISIRGRCPDLPCLNEFSDVVVPSCFKLSHQTSWTAELFSGTGRLAQTTVQGNCLFKVMGQEKCEFVQTALCSKV